MLGLSSDIHQLADHSQKAARFSAELLGSFLNKYPESFSSDCVISVWHADGVHVWLYRLRGGCLCTDNLWKYDIQSQTWEFQPVTNVPIDQYGQTTEMFQGALFFFGGESYTPYMYHNSVMRIGTTLSKGKKKEYIDIYIYIKY